MRREVRVERRGRKERRQSDWNDTRTNGEDVGLDVLALAIPLCHLCRDSDESAGAMREEEVRRNRGKRSGWCCSMLRGVVEMTEYAEKGVLGRERWKGRRELRER